MSRGVAAPRAAPRAAACSSSQVAEPRSARAAADSGRARLRRALARGACAARRRLRRARQHVLAQLVREGAQVRLDLPRVELGEARLEHEARTPICLARAAPTGRELSVIISTRRAQVHLPEPLHDLEAALEGRRRPRSACRGRSTSTNGMPALRSRLRLLDRRLGVVRLDAPGSRPALEARPAAAHVVLVVHQQQRAGVSAAGRRGARAGARGASGGAGRARGAAGSERSVGSCRRRAPGGTVGSDGRACCAGRRWYGRPARSSAALGGGQFGRPPPAGGASAGLRPRCPRRSARASTAAASLRAVLVHAARQVSSSSCGLMPAASVSARMSRPATVSGTWSVSSKPNCALAQPDQLLEREARCRRRTAVSRAAGGSVASRGSGAGECAREGARPPAPRGRRWRPRRPPCATSR